MFDKTTHMSHNSTLFKTQKQQQNTHKYKTDHRGLINIDTQNKPGSIPHLEKEKM